MGVGLFQAIIGVSCEPTGSPLTAVLIDGGGDRQVLNWWDQPRGLIGRSGDRGANIEFTWRTNSTEVEDRETPALLRITSNSDVRVERIVGRCHKVFLIRMFWF